MEMKKLLFLLSFLLLGCTSKPKIEIVHVPVSHPIVLEIPERPDLAIQKITEKSQNSDVIKAYGRTVDQLIIYSNILIRIIEKNNELQQNDTKDKK